MRVLKLFARYAGIIGLIAAAAQGRTITLTGVAVYNAEDASGNMVWGGWDTSGHVSGLYLSLNGQSVAPDIDISAPGTYFFTYNTGGTGSGAYADLALFFDGVTAAPGIHVAIQRSNPAELLVTTSSGYCLGYGSCTTSGPGSLTYDDGLVSLRAFTSDPGSPTGVITLSVGDGSSVPEPASIALVGLALAVLCGRVRRGACSASARSRIRLSV